MSSKYRFTLIVGVFLFLRRGKEILVAKRQNTGYGDGLWHVPAGHLDGGETIIAAMRREAKEELGIEIAENDLTLVHVMHHNSDSERLHLFFEATKWEGKLVNNEPEKCSKLTWYDIGKVPEDMIDYTKQAIDCYKKDQRISVYNW